MERRTYTKEFKQEAVQLSHESDSTITQVAQNLGVRPELLYRWKREQRQEGTDAFPGKGMSKPSEEEIRRHHFGEPTGIAFVDATALAV